RRRTPGRLSGARGTQPLDVAAGTRTGALAHGGRDRARSHRARASWRRYAAGDADRRDRRERADGASARPVPDRRRFSARLARPSADVHHRPANDLTVATRIIYWLIGSLAHWLNGPNEPVSE